jgi:hypothetical protein
MSEPRIFDSATLGIIFDGPQRRVRVGEGAQKSSIARFIRMIRRTPEVMVRITGSGKRSGQIRAHLTYIMRNGTLEAENERGDILTGRADIDQVMKEWSFVDRSHRKPRALSVHMILSMPTGTRAAGVLGAARAFAAERLVNHEYLLVLHTDTPHPHVHIAVKAQGFDLTWLKRSKADLQSWRETFAQQLRIRGIPAEATPRRARGMHGRSDSRAQHHLNRSPWRFEQMRRKVEDAIRDMANPNFDAPSNRVDERLTQRREVLNSAFLKIATELRRVASKRRLALAEEVEQFAKDLPRIESERAKLQRELTTFFAAEARIEPKAPSVEPGRAR